MTTALQKTTRREARENYVRYLLSEAGVSGEDAEQYLITPQAALESSILDLIYTGDYEKAVSVVERFTEELNIEEDENLV